MRLSPLTCHACGHPVPSDSEARRGFLINEAARLGAKLVELEAQLARAHRGPPAVLEARGVDGDTFAAEWTVHVCPPASNCRQQKRCRAAGPVRNGRMLRQVQPGLVAAFPTGGPGTADCMSQARGLGRAVKEFRE